MGVEIKGTNCKIWKREHEKKDGSKWFSYTVGISRKNMDGTWINGYQKVEFSRNSGAPEIIPNGATCDFEGFMTVKPPYKDKEGREIKESVIMITRVEFEDLGTPGDDDLDSFEQLDSEIPF